MHDIIELSSQIGAMHSSNPIINFVYKLRKKKMFKEVIKRIDRLPEIPSDEDIRYFSLMIPVWLGMDFDGGFRELSGANGEECSIFCNMNLGVIRYICISDYIRCDIIMRNNKIDSCRIFGIYVNSVNNTQAYRCIGIVIKAGLKEACTNMILGGM